ncbi:MAG: hypothetical protein IJT68_10140 [Lentisphaeria bacterium]|nr:hypothetical protein [Lentisphaeria bacterium]
MIGPVLKNNSSFHIVLSKKVLRNSTEKELITDIGSVIDRSASQKIAWSLGDKTFFTERYDAVFVFQGDGIVDTNEKLHSLIHICSFNSCILFYFWKYDYDENTLLPDTLKRNVFIKNDSTVFHTKELSGYSNYKVFIPKTIFIDRTLTYSYSLGTPLKRRYFYPSLSSPIDMSTLVKQWFESDGKRYLLANELHKAIRENIKESNIPISFLDSISFSCFFYVTDNSADFFSLKPSELTELTKLLRKSFYSGCILPFYKYKCENDFFLIRPEKKSWNERFHPDRIDDYIGWIIKHNGYNFLNDSLIKDALDSSKYVFCGMVIGKYIPLHEGICVSSSYCLINVEDNTGKNDYAKFFDAVLCSTAKEMDFLLDKFVLEDTRSRFMRKSISSAIGSIMSRNGSHNIGSHVLSTLTHHVGTMPDDRVLYQYIQQRMDYIATITTDIPNWGASTMFVGDMMKTFFSQHHLLEFISGSEGLHAYSFQDPNLSLELRRKQENTIKLHIRRIGKGAGKLAFNKDFKKTEEKTDWDDVANAKANALHFICYPDREKIHFIDYVEDRPIPLQEDTTLSIPGGVVGEHAFFTILENIIRNAAKHGWATSSKKEKNLEIYIDFIDNPDSDFVEFTIWDNMSDVLKPIKKSEGGSAEKYIKLFKVLASVKDILSAEIDISESNGDSSNALAPKKPTRSEWIKKKFKGLAGKIGDISEENTEPDSDLLSDFEKNLDDILKNNRREFEQILCKPLTREEIRMITRAKKEARDFDKCLPLHMCQQQLLEQPLITEQGELRRENWGLAEMRISAGYLQQRSITEIGGLEELKDDDFIVHVVAMPGVCTCESNQNGGIRCDAKKCDNKTNCPIESKLYHLGYRFKVWKPREMLIVFDETDDNYSFGGQKIAKNDLIKMLPEFKKNGVYFAVMSGNECILINSTESLNATDQSNNDIVITEFNFGYVVFSNKETAEKCGTALLEKNSGNIDSASRKAQEKTGDEKNEEWKSQFPFRLLYENLKIELNNSSAQKNIQSVKNAVYAAWLEKLQKFRALPGNKNCLTMQIQTEERGNASAGQGLITNRNLLEYVFRKNYLPVLSRQSFSHIENDPYTLILDLLKLYPQPYKKIPDQKNWEDDISRMIRITLQRICEDFERSYYDIRALIRHSEFVDGAKSEDDKKEFCGVIYEQINGQRDGARLKNAILNIPESVFCERIRAFSIASKGCGNDEIRKLLRGETSMKHASPFAVLVDSPVEIITKELKNAYDISDSLLRKYEERITTLPHGYSINQTDGRESKKSVMKELNKNLSQVHIKLVGDGDNPRIKYCRHDKDCPEGCLYAEALSGSQSYLNTLHRIMHPSDSSQSQDPEQKDSIGMFVRLAENALMRVLIIDERVSNFLKDHTANKSVFEAMKIDVVDIQEDFFLKEDDLKCPSSLPLLTNTEKTPAASERRWDILIIHQGIIDKVLEDHHDENHVEELINEIKYVDYKVVTTGRGRPDNIPNSVKVLPFSMIEGTLFRNYPEKMLLVNAVMNALPYSRNKH